MSEDDREEISVPDVPTQNRAKKRPVTWVILVVVLLVVIGILGGLNFAKNASSATPNIIGAQSIATAGEPYALSLYTGKFVNASVYFGDNSVKTLNYTGQNGVQVQHTYEAAGNYLIYYSVNKGGATYNNSGQLVSVQVLPSSTPSIESQGFDQVVLQNSSAMLVNNESNLFLPGDHVTTILGYYANPLNTTYSVFAQSAKIYRNGNMISKYNAPYKFNSSTGAYTLATGQGYLNLSSVKGGIYTIVVETQTGVVNSTTGKISTSVASAANYYYLNIAVFKKGGLYSPSSQTTTLVDVNKGQGPYRTLDQGVASDVVSDQVLQNTEQTLVMYNGSSTSQFKPMLASQVPSVSDGGINSNYHNYTVHTPWGTTYREHIKPYENYTFHIRANATWQNGKPVTAWDAQYSLARSLIFIGDSPSNNIATLGRLILPGNIYTSNTFYNITQNITVNNASNTITIHFQTPVSTAQALGLFTGGNTYIESAAYMASQATAQQPALRWSSAGFKAYKPQGNTPDFNKNLQTQILSDGPYKISYQVASSAIVLVKNPAYNPPGNWFPAASISKVVNEYIQKTSTRYLAMLSNSAQVAGIPSTDWNLVQNLEHKNVATTVSVPTPGLRWFEFNANINTTMLDNLYPASNVPSTLFTVLPIRLAFAYAMNYQYFINNQVGNKVYNGTFASLYAGVMPSGITGSQSISQLNKSTTGVPYFNLQIAKAYWKEGVKVWDSYFPAGSPQQITKATSGTYAGDYVYNNKPLVIPMFQLTGFPAYKAALGTWGTTMQQVIPGSSYPIRPVTIGVEVGYLSFGQNPMPIARMGWLTGNSYPTSTLLPIGLPAVGSSFTSPDGFVPQFFTNTTANPTTNQTQAGIMQRMIDEYDNGSSSFHTAVALKWFHMMNQDLVNMTMYVWMGQVYSQYVISKNLNVQMFEKYNSNPLTTSAPDLFFNGISYK